MHLLFFGLFIKAVNIANTTINYFACLPMQRSGASPSIGDIPSNQKGTSDKNDKLDETKKNF